MTDLVLNRNFYNYLGFMLFAGVYQNTTPAQIGTAYSIGKGFIGDGYSVTHPCPLTDTNGEHKDGIYMTSYSSSGGSYSFNNTFFNFNYYGGYISFACGTGDTDATVNDTELVTPNSNITATILTGERDTTTSIVYTVKFSSAEEQILREIGLIRSLNTASNKYSPILLGRAVLDNNIPLNEDNNYSVTLQIRLSLTIPV